MKVNGHRPETECGSVNTAAVPGVPLVCTVMVGPTGKHPGRHWGTYYRNNKTEMYEWD